MTSAPKTEKPKKRSRILPWLAAGCLIVCAVIGFIMINRDSSKTADRLASRLADRVSFGVYAPAWLPDGWYVDENSATATADVATFTVSDAHGKRLVFTEQPKPPQTSLETFYDQQLSESSTFTTGVGKVVSGQFEGSLLAGISTDRTWILVRAISVVGEREFDQIIRGVKLASDKP